MTYRIWNTKKLIIISRPKIASSFLDHVFFEFPENRNVFSLTHELTLKFDNSKTQDGVQFEIENIFNGKSKKDILILYRSPLKKFLSGTIQDFDNGFLKLDKHHHFLIENFFKDYPEFKKFILLKYSIIEEFLKDVGSERNEEFEKYYSKLLFEFASFIIENNIISGHNDNTNYLTYSLINEKIIDKNKLYLLDIDSAEKNTLMDFLKKYEIQPKRKEYRNSQKTGADLLHRMIRNNKHLNVLLHDNIKVETFFYNLLQSSKYNIIK